MEINFSEKYRFEELLDSFMSLSSQKSEEGVDKLISLLEFNPMKRKNEIYKYTLFVFVRYKEMISEIMLGKVQLESFKIEKLKILLVGYLQGDQELKPLNDLVKGVFPEVFQNEGYYMEMVNKNRNNLVSNNKNAENEKIVKNVEIKQNFAKPENQFIPKVENSFIPPKVENFSVPKQSEERIKFDPPINKNSNEQLVRNGPPQISQNHQPNRDFELSKKVQSSEQINIQNPLQIRIDHLQIIFDSSTQKHLEDIKSKIDEIIRKISSYENINVYMRANIQGQGVDIFSQPGYFNDIGAPKLSLLPVEYKLKFITVYSKLIYTLSENQRTRVVTIMEKYIIDDQNFDRSTKEKILTNLFYNLKFQSLIDKKMPVTKEVIAKELKNLYQPEKDIVNSEIFANLMRHIRQKSDVYDLFYIHILNKNFRFLKSFAADQINFILYLIMTQVEYFQSEDSYEMLYNLYIMKIYYEEKESKIFKDFLQLNENGEINYRGVNLSNIEKYHAIDYKSLFTSGEIKKANDVLKIINHFYKYEFEGDAKSGISNYTVSSNPGALLSTKGINFEFTRNIIELVNRKMRYIQKDPKIYKNNLIELEKTLFNNYRKFNQECKDNSYDSFNINLYSEQIDAFKEVGSMVDKLLKEHFKGKFSDVKLYPFGSITQFLGSKESDLDLFLHISGGSYKDRFNLLNSITSEVHSKYGIPGNKSTVISKRLITITFSTRKNIKVDINYFGVCSVLNSTLLRVYAQCDMRFVILAYNLKIMLKKLNINNTDERKVYLNSFTWMLLLVTFLQDVIEPPVLPKILSKVQPSILRIESANTEKKDNMNNFKKDKKDKNYKKEYYKSKSTYDIISQCVMKEYQVNLNFFKEGGNNSESFKKIYEDFQNSLERKNEMGLSELFLKFLEFVIFYLKYDTIFTHTSFSGECFANRSDLKNFEATDRNFVNLYRYLTKKGDYLVRDPFDHTYNPAQMGNQSTKEFIDILKKYYFNLLETGNFHQSN